MLSYARNYFRNCRLARMSNGEYCLIRDQGLVKGGRGLKHHETLIVFSIRGLAAKCFQPFTARFTAGWLRQFPATLLRVRARAGIWSIRKPAMLRRTGLLTGHINRSPLDQRHL
jgi:hypothetical protein